MISTPDTRKAKTLQREDRAEAQALLNRMVATAAAYNSIGRPWPSALLDRIRDLLHEGGRLDGQAPPGLAAAVTRGLPRKAAAELLGHAEGGRR